MAIYEHWVGTVTGETAAPLQSETNTIDEWIPSKPDLASSGIKNLGKNVYSGEFIHKLYNATQKIGPFHVSIGIDAFVNVTIEYYQL